MVFVIFFSCHDPQFLEEVVRFSKNHSKFWRIFFYWKLLSVCFMGNHAYWWMASFEKPLRNSQFKKVSTALFRK